MPESVTDGRERNGDMTAQTAATCQPALRIPGVGFVPSDMRSPGGDRRLRAPVPAIGGVDDRDLPGHSLRAWSAPTTWGYGVRDVVLAQPRDETARFSRMGSSGRA
jgi:hypothetical protein